MTPSRDIALIYHYRLTDAIKGEDVDWELVAVDLKAGRDIGDRLAAIKEFEKVCQVAFAVVEVSSPAPSTTATHDAPLPHQQRPAPTCQTCINWRNS